jgi:hypothetical protein
LAVAAGLSAQLISGSGAKAQGIAFDKDGVPRPVFGTGTYESIPDWMKVPANYFNCFGIAYPGEGWDIGAYQFYPGKYPGMPLLHNPIANNFVVIVPPFNLHIVVLGEQNPPAQAPVSTDPTVISIQGKLQQLAKLAATLPRVGEDQYYPGLHDYFTNSCNAKFFFSSSTILDAFYYNGSLGGNKIQIADFPGTPGLQGNEYVKTNQTLQFGTDWFTTLFTSTEITNIQKVSTTNGLYLWIMLPDYSKNIWLHYGEDFLTSVLNDTNAVQRAYMDQSTPQEVTSIDQALISVVRGTAPAAQGLSVKLDYDHVCFGTNGNQLYDQTLDLIISNVQAAVTH